MKIKRKKSVPLYQNANPPQNAGVYGYGYNQLNVQGIKRMPDLNFGFSMPTSFSNPQETRIDPYKEGFTPTTGQGDESRYYNPSVDGYQATGNQNTKNQFLNSFAGTLPTGDLGYSLNTLGRSLAFNPNNLGDNVPQSQKNMLKGANIGRGVAAGATALFSGAREFMGGFAQQKRQDFLTAENSMNSRKQLINYNSPEQGYESIFRNKYPQEGTPQYAQNGGFFQNGGSDVEMEELMSGRSSTGMPEQNEGGYNAELESREFLQRNDGSVTKVEGDRHTQGGEKFKMEGGDKVISDNIKIGVDDKMFFRQMGLRVNSDTTYANVVEKFRKKIGLNDIFSEQEALFKKLKKNEEVEDEQTKKQNEAFVGEKINETEQQKTELAQLESFFTDLVFKKQETRKKEGGDKIFKNKVINPYEDFDGNTITAKNGGKINVYFEDGGVFTDSDEMNKEFQKWAGAKGFKTDEEVLNHLQGYFMQDGGEVDQQQQIVEAVAQALQQGQDPSEILQALVQQGIPQEQAQQLIQEVAQQIQQSQGAPQQEQQAVMQQGGVVPKMQNATWTPDTYIDSPIINDQKLFVKQPYTTALSNEGYLAGAVTEDEFNNRLNAQVERLPFLTRNYLNKKQPLGGEGIGKFQTTYNDYATHAIEQVMANPYMSDDQKKVYVDRIKTEVFNKDSKAKGYDPVKSVDKKYGNFTSSRPSFAIPVLTEEELKKHPEATYIDKILNEKGEIKPEYSDLSQKTKDYVLKLATNPLGRDLGVRTYTPPAAPNPADPKAEEVVSTPENKELELWRNNADGLRGSYFPMESQLRVPPQSMWDNAYATFSPPKLSPIKVSPEIAIRENARAEDATRDILNRTMGAQGAANMSALLGQEIQGNNQAVQQANVQNAQYAMQADQINNQNDWAAQQANANAMSLYNKEQSVSFDNTMNDWRKYWELKSTDRIDANKELMALNTAASLAPNLYFNPNTGVTENGYFVPYTIKGAGNPVVSASKTNAANYRAYLDKMAKNQKGG